MKFFYGLADEKFVKIDELHHEPIRTSKPSVLDSYKFCALTFLQPQKRPNLEKESIVFRASPDSLLNLASKVVDTIKLPIVYEWTTDDVCSWIKKYGYPQYRETFRVNCINGHTLLLVDAAALSAMNIKRFDHIKHITYGIRLLFHFHMAKFARSISLPPNDYYELFKLFRVRTGYQYEHPRKTDFWRRLQLLRPVTPTYTHWELLERHVNPHLYKKQTEWIGGARRFNLYKCKEPAAEKPVALPKSTIGIYCMPPCTCCWTETDIRVPTTLRCIDRRSVFTPRSCSCIPPCEWDWRPLNYKLNTSIKILRKEARHKYDIPLSTDERFSTFSRHHSVISISLRGK